jgi:hypothetical protein
VAAVYAVMMLAFLLRAGQLKAGMLTGGAPIGRFIARLVPRFSPVPSRRSPRWVPRPLLRRVVPVTVDRSR